MYKTVRSAAGARKWPLGSQGRAGCHGCSLQPPHWRCPAAGSQGGPGHSHAHERAPRVAPRGHRAPSIGTAKRPWPCYGNAPGAGLRRAPCGSQSGNPNGNTPGMCLAVEYIHPGLPVSGRNRAAASLGCCVLLWLQLVPRLPSAMLTRTAIEAPRVAQEYDTEQD